MMEQVRRGLTGAAIGVGLVIAVQPGVAAVKTRIDYDKTFDFRQARTWAWSAEAGRVMLARTPEDNPEETKRLAEPIIKDAVNLEIPKRGLTPATGTPDLELTYYLLLTFGSQSQQLGQFVPGPDAWALPPFAAATTWVEVIEQGSLVLDLSAKGEVVWRGVGQAQIKMALPREKRAALIREAVKEILGRYPPKK